MAKKKIVRMSKLSSLKLKSISQQEQIRRLEAAQDTLQLALRSIAELYPRDPSGPGMCLAYIAGEKKFYASMLRYDGGYGTGKQVLCSVKEDSLEEAITELVIGFVHRTENTQRLRKVMGKEVKEDAGKQVESLNEIARPGRGKRRGISSPQDDWFD